MPLVSEPSFVRKSCWPSACITCEVFELLLTVANIDTFLLGLSYGYMLLIYML